MKTKICNKCNCVLSIDFFDKHEEMLDGHLNRCKNCISEYNQEYHQKNKDKHNAAAKVWRAENKERDRDLHAAWRANNPDKIKEYQRKADARYNKTIKATAKRKRRNDQIKNTKQAPISLTAILNQYGMFCHICQKAIEHESQLAFDHIIPLARQGTHTVDNLKPAHRSCNSWKLDRLMEELIGQTPPLPTEVDDWKIRRQKRANELRSESMKQAWQEQDWSERNAKVSASMMGNTNGSFTKGIKKGPMSEENKQKIFAANKGKLKKHEISNEKIIALYNQGIGITAIGRELRIDKMTVKKRLISAGIL